MAPIKKIQVTDQTKMQPPTAAPHGPSAPTNAPTQVSAVTAEGVQKKTGPTFNQSPALKPSPPDRGSVNIINDKRQPAPRGPAPAMGLPGGQQQQGR